MTTTTTGLTTISLVCVPTVEQDKAVAFYESLGFEKRTDEPFGGGYRWIEVYAPEGTTGIALAPPPPEGGPVAADQYRYHADHQRHRRHPRGDSRISVSTSTRRWREWASRFHRCSGFATRPGTP